MLTINIDGLEKRVKPELNNSEKNIKSARDLLSSIKIPSSFTYYSRLKSMPSTLLEIEEKMEETEKWIDERIKMFTSAESSNNNIVDSLVSSITSMVSFSNIGETAVVTEQKNTANGIFENVTNFFSDAYDYISSGDFILDAKEFASKTASKVTDNIKSGIEGFLNTGAQFLSDVKSTIESGIENIGEALENVGAKIVEVGKWVYEKAIPTVVNTIMEMLKTTGATIANIFIGAIKGLAELVQSLVKGVALLSIILNIGQDISNAVAFLGTALITSAPLVIAIYTNAKDSGVDTTDFENFVSGFFTKTLPEFLNNSEKYLSLLFEQTMALFAEDYVGDVFDLFYDTKAGQVLDEHAIGVFKSDGIGTNIVSGVTYVVGIIAAAIFTGGAAGLATGGTTAITAGIAGVSGFGKYTSEKWAEFRDESWEGINRLYEEGEITEEQYNTFVYIRGLTDEGWAEIENAYKNGEIGEEEFALMQQIRELPEEWATAENAFKGITYGAASGLWEGVQWYLGGKLSSFALEGASKLTNSAIRVGIDSTFNATDTPYRALIDSMTTGKDLEQAWIEQGGWEAMLSNLGIGLIGSVGGEAFDNLGGKIDTGAGLSDEIYSVDKLDNAVPISFSGSIKTIDDAIKATLNKYGIPITPEKIKVLRDRVYSGNYSCITRTNGARDKVIQLTSQIKSLVNVLNTGNISDPKVVKLIQDSFEKWMGDSPYAEKLASKLIKLKQKYPELTFEIDPDGGCYWYNGTKTLRLGNNNIIWGDSGTLAHETGHLLFDLVLNEKLPKKWDNIVAKARVLSSNKNNAQLLSTLSNLNDAYYANYDKAIEEFNQLIRKMGYGSQAEYVQAFESYLNKVDTDRVIDWLKGEGIIDSNTAKSLKGPGITKKDIATVYVKGKISTIKESLNRLKEGGSDCAISDIICSVYEGTNKDLNGREIYWTYSHSEEYYSKVPILAFHEIIANFTQLKMSGNTKALEQIRNIFGDEFYLELEKTFNKLLK